MSTLTAESKNVVALWDQISAKLREMTPEERAGTLVSAGILTEKGNVTKRYKNVIVPAKVKSSIKLK